MSDTWSVGKELGMKEFNYEGTRYWRDEKDRLYTDEMGYAGWVNEEQNTIWIRDHVGMCLRTLTPGGPKWDADWWQSWKLHTKMKK